MINDLDIVQWDYLLSPEFEMVNSAGKPLTGGYIEVYIHGTRNKYYCASDFNGTLHPFQIPLDSLGSNIVLASPDNAYDVYVYNKYGSLIMSRYNVHCQGTGGGGGSYTGDKLFYGQYTAHNVAETASLSKTKGNINLNSDGYLQLKQGMSYHITVRGAFQVDDVANTETTLNYIEYSTISPIKVDIDFTKADPQNFELSYDIYDLAEDMAYQVAFEQINGMVTDLVVEIHSLSNLATTATFDYEAGDYISIVDNTISVTGINPEDYSTHSETYESIVTAIQMVTGIMPDDAATHDEVYEATVTAINFVTGIIPEAQVQSDWTETDDTDPSYIKNKPDLDIYATHDEVTSAVTSIDLSDYATHTEVYEAAVTAVQAATGAIPDVSDFATHDEVHDTAVTAIQLVTGIIPDVSDFITHDEVNTVSSTIIETVNNVSGEIVETVNDVSSVLHEEMIEIGQAATGAIPDVSDFTTHEDVFESAVTSIQLVTGMIPDVSDYATHDEVHESIVTAMEYVTGIIPDAQVQSNWTETDNEDPSYIQNKPNELPLVAGDGITITEDLDHITITANVTSIDGYATIYEVNTVSSTIIETVNNVSSVLHEEIQNIPEQVQSDWDETNTSSKAYIQNKPTIPSIDGLASEAFVTGYIDQAISEIPEYTAGDYINIDNYEINVTGLQPEGDYATHTDLIEAVSAVTGICDYGQFYSTNITGAATMSRTKGTIEVTNDGKIKLKKGQSYHVTVRGRYNQTTSANTYGDVSYIEYITGQSIHVNVDKTITDSQYFEISYDLYKLSNDSDYYVFLSMNGGTVNDLFIEIHAIGSVGVGGSGGGGGTEYDAGWGIQILNNVISVNPSIIPVVTGFATKEELQDGIELVTGLIPDVSDFTTETQVTALIQEAVTSIGPGTTYTAGDYISIENNEISVTGTEDLTMKNLTAGEGITITESGNNIVISSSVTGTPVVTGYVTDEELQDGLELVTGLIPTVQLNSNDQVTAINNYPLAGGGGGTSYTAGDYIDITNDVISVTGTEDLTLMNLTAGEGISITTDVSGNVEIACAGGGGGGSDETVLWSGTFSGSTGSSNYITLSEATTNFNTIEITMGGGYLTKLRYAGAAISWQVFSPFVNGANGTVIYAGMYTVTNNGTRVYSNPWAVINQSGWSTDSDMNVGEQQLTKVIGINRISGGNS